jgi:hypothetical protein
MKLFLSSDAAQNTQFAAGTLSLIVARNGTKLEKTSLSTDGSKLPACDIVYFAQLRLLKTISKLLSNYLRNSY